MSERISIVFFGTHEFAAAILSGLLTSPLFQVDLVVTQPDRPIGRKQELQASAVKLLAQKHSIAIEQPASLKNFQLPISNLDVGIVAEYGILIPQKIISSFPHGMINVHTSLLPKYRGASPIQTALLNGDTETGVTIMTIDAGLDTGDILLQKTYAIGPDETYKTVSANLAPLGIAGLQDAVPAFCAGTLTPTKQDTNAATTCRELTRDDGQVNWQHSSHNIYNQYRGLTPWPGLWTTWEGKRLKLLTITMSATSLPAGQVMIQDHRLFIGCGDSSAIEITSLQLEGKIPMDVPTFLNGFQTFAHANLV